MATMPVANISLPLPKPSPYPMLLRRELERSLAEETYHSDLPASKDDPASLRIITSYESRRQKKTPPRMARRGDISRDLARIFYSAGVTSLFR